MPTSLFSDWLQERIRDHGWSPTEFARRIRTSHPVILSWLGGSTKPSPKKCELIAEALGLPLQEVLIRAGHIPETAREIDLSQVDYRAAIRAQHPAAEAERLIEVINALLDVDKRLKERESQEGHNYGET